MKKLSIMANNSKTLILEGRKCSDVSPLFPPVDAICVGWKGKISHPNAPQGGGGPGMFAQQQPLSGSGNHSSTNFNQNSMHRFHPQSAKPLGGAPAQLAALKKNPPPATKPEKIKLKSQKSRVVEVELYIEIKADERKGVMSGDAKTEYKLPSYSFPGYRHDSSGKIIRFNGRYEWKGSIVIQTFYGPGAYPKDLSCYGRGTTKTDVQKGDITLGFHESCHREEYVKYLNDHPLTIPDLKVGMTVHEYESEQQKFKQERENYNKAMEQYSYDNTDEVGHKKSQKAQTGKCYQHGSQPRSP